jgi:hypothetical protein
LNLLDAIAYFGSPRTRKLEVPKFNNTTSYIFGSVSLKQGLLVLESPAATDNARCLKNGVRLLFSQFSMKLGKE